MVSHNSKSMTRCVYGSASQSLHTCLFCASQSWTWPPSSRKGAPPKEAHVPSQSRWDSWKSALVRMHRKHNLQILLYSPMYCLCHQRLPQHLFFEYRYEIRGCAYTHTICCNPTRAHGYGWQLEWCTCLRFPCHFVCILWTKLCEVLQRVVIIGGEQTSSQSWASWNDNIHNNDTWFHALTDAMQLGWCR